MSPQTAHSWEGDGGAGPRLVDGDCSGTIPPGDELADDDALGCGAGTARSFGDSLLLVDSDLCKGNDALLCLGDSVVVT